MIPMLLINILGFGQKYFIFVGNLCMFDTQNVIQDSDLSHTALGILSSVMRRCRDATADPMYPTMPR